MGSTNGEGIEVCALAVDSSDNNRLKLDVAAVASDAAGKPQADFCSDCQRVSQRPAPELDDGIERAFTKEWERKVQAVILLNLDIC